MTRDAGPATRVVVVAPSARMVGGQSVQAHRLLRAFEGSPGTTLRLVPIDPALPGILGRLQRIKYVRTLVTWPAYVWSLLRAMGGADVAHVYSASYFSFVMTPTPALLVARLFGVPVVLNYHSGEARDHLTRWRTAVPTLRLADRLVVPSEYLVGVFRDFGLRAEAIPNALELGRLPFRERERLDPVFLSARNLEAHYGVDTVLRAFRRILERVPEARLIVAGSGPEGAALRALAQELGCARRTDFLGRVEPADMAALYDRADVFLNASEVDNMPLSILEALAVGLPVVTSDAGGIPFLVEDGRTALVVPPRAPGALAAGALRLLAEPALARQLSVEGRREVASRYTMAGVLPSWERLYRRMAGGDDGLGESARPVGSGRAS